MNRRSHLRGACALALVVFLAASPMASAKQQDTDREIGFTQRISRVIKKLQKFVGDIAAHVDYPTPPRP